MLLITFGFPCALFSQSLEGYNICLKMFEECRKIETFYFEMKKTERVNGTIYLTEYYNTKLNYNPFHLYSKKIETGKNPELLYRQDENGNKALINPDGFPWFNLSLDPKGIFMRKNQHHTLFETGYKYALSILEHLFRKYGEEVIQMTTLKQSATINDRECYVIELNNPHFNYINYKVQKNEDVLDIAKKFMLSEYMIVEVNKDVDDYRDVFPGQLISIPYDYSPRLIIAIDKERLIPISLKVYDDKGLYEQLEYMNVTLNPNFSKLDFSEENPNYGF